MATEKHGNIGTIIKALDILRSFGALNVYAGKGVILAEPDHRRMTENDVESLRRLGFEYSALDRGFVCKAKHINL